jgi:glycosyltransferase involved in cell wall biosynthesis
VTRAGTRPLLPRGAEWLPREGNAGADASTRRILLLTTTYPPRTEVGAARWEGFTPHLAVAGWGIDAVIEQSPAWEPPDRDRLARLPVDVRVAAIATPAPWWQQAMRRARAPFRRGEGSAEEYVHAVSAYDATQSDTRIDLRHVVDAAVHASRARRGMRDLRRAALAVVDERHRVVVSSGPPHYVHVAASRVAQKLGVPHVVDLRDPWGKVESRGLAARLIPDRHLRRFEAVTLERAALVITNTAAAERALAERFPALRARIRCMPNGSDVEPVDPASRPAPSRFVIAHCGSLYLDRDPRPFLRAVGRVRERLALGADDLGVVFMGHPARVGGRSMTELAAEAGLGGLFEERPAGPRDAARQLLRESSMAVAFQGESRTQIPAKIFEYVAFPLWVLALVGTESATADLLAGSDAIVLDIDDESGAERAIDSCFRRFRAGESARPVGWDGRFSRARQAERLVAELARLEGSFATRGDAASAAQSLTRSNA